MESKMYLASGGLLAVGLLVLFVALQDAELPQPQRASPWHGHLLATTSASVGAFATGAATESRANSRPSPYSAWASGYIASLSNGDCKGIASGERTWCDTNDCKGIASGDRTWCDTTDCKGVATKDRTWCESSLCKAWATGDRTWCDDNDCKGVATRDRTWCDSAQCKAIASGDRTWCP
ncbi:MAG: hypothetical protein JRI25_03095 [Deltaproteobacteria bacterium]|nr:hypothetical protein [Deltaproteobacteria bacterium]MBW2253570.1 hypothetical protein [Deltaproteobacteria bacterium]